MPPRSKITKDMIIDAGLNIVRNEGQESLNVRRIAAELDCSTQPVMYHYKTVDELKADIYFAADEFHTNYIMTPDEIADVPFLSIGMKYIKFADEESHLFRFLFQSDKFKSSFSELTSADALAPIIEPMCKAFGLTEEKAGEVFDTVFMTVHGAASLLANNSLSYDEAYFRKLLTAVFNGMIER